MDDTALVVFSDGSFYDRYNYIYRSYGTYRSPGTVGVSWAYLVSPSGGDVYYNVVNDSYGSPVTGNTYDVHCVWPSGDIGGFDVYVGNSYGRIIAGHKWNIQRLAYQPFWYYICRPLRCS